MNRFLKLKSSGFLIILVFCIVLAPFSIFEVKAQASTPTLTISPEVTSKLPVGSSFTVYVEVSNAVNVGASQIWVQYDSTVLNATEVDEGPFLKQSGSTIVIPYPGISQVISPKVSQVVFADSALLSGVSGSGILCNITFNVISEGAALLHIVPFNPKAVDASDGSYLSDLFGNNILPLYGADAYYSAPITISASKTIISEGDSITLNGTLYSAILTNVTSLQVLTTPLLVNTLTPLATLQVNNNNFQYQWTSNETGVFVFEVACTLPGNNTFTSTSVEIAVVQPLQAWGMNFLYAVTAIIIVLVVISVLLSVRSRKKKIAEQPVL